MLIARGFSEAAAMKPKHSFVPMMQRICLVTGVLPVLLAFSGCGSWVMRADFDNYIPNTSGSALEGDILGKPDGDRIDVHCVGGDVRIQQGSPVNSLRINQCQTGVEFTTASHELPGSYTINWNGNVEFVENSMPTFISLRFEEERIMLRFLTSNLDIMRNGTPQADPITVSTLTSHTFEIEVTAGSDGMLSLEYQEIDPQTGPEPLIERSLAVGNLGRLESIIVNQNGEFSGYVISDLDVFARN
jgi:hypothetical protein